MRISRFFIDQPLSTDSAIDINDERAHYIRNVLRLKPGDSLVLFNGQGGEYRAIVSDVSKKTVTAQTTHFDSINRNLSRSITLGLGILKRDAMDLALQKAVELGTSNIQPLITDRVTVSAKQIKTRLQHWQSIATSSCEQCGLNLVPRILEPKPLSEWISSLDEICFIAEPGAEIKAFNIEASQSPISILVGPEGGFTDQEVELARESGLQGVNLGTRILRAETAAISLLTLVNQSLLESDSSNF